MGKSLAPRQAKPGVPPGIQKSVHSISKWQPEIYSNIS